MSGERGGVSPPVSGERVSARADAQVTDEDRRFWSFQPPQRPAIPAVNTPDRVVNPLDAFILRKLEDRRLTLSPEADRTTLVRRVFLDLTGLLPTPDEIVEFVNDLMVTSSTYRQSSRVTEQSLTGDPDGRLLSRMPMRRLEAEVLCDTTLVVWGGEMGRLPIAQLPADKDERKAGRDHNKNAMVTWLAGGGVKGGLTLGQTDELGFSAVEDRVSVTDWHATLLHLLGLHHEELFLERNGLKERLTGVEQPRIVREIFV